MSYNLYLDESALRTDNQRAYCVAGVIIEKGQPLYHVRKLLGRIKSTVWSDSIGYAKAKQIILHEAEMRSLQGNILQKRPEYKSFKQASNVRTVVSGIGEIITGCDLKILGVLENQSRIESTYGTKRTSYTSYYLALKIIVENFCYFLKAHNSTGEIIFESRRTNNSSIQDKRVRKMYSKILAHGTVIYSAIDIQDCIKGILFIQKQENDAGLQIADFIPHPFLLNYCKIPQTKPSIYQNLRKARYTGELDERFGASKYGVRIID